jgi:polyisoprenoid-binding protein YceI
MTRSRLLVVAAIAVIALGVGAYLAYDNVLRGDAAAPLALPSAAVATDTAGGTATDPTAPDPTAAASTAAGASTAPVTGSDGDVAGTWTLVEGSEAGYRVREQLANLPAESDAVGRTTDVSGSITLVAAGDAAQLTEGSITVDTTTIASDERRRDDRMRSEGLQTDQFPTATFTITGPVDIPAAALAGTATDLTLTGDLTLHGVTKSVQIPAQAQLVDGQVQVAGALPITLADYQIVAPNVGGFIVSIADNGTLEFLAVFAKA